MALEAWFRQDITNALLAAEQSSRAALQAGSNGDDDSFVAGYQAGYQAALTTMALAFGLLPRQSVGTPFLPVAALAEVLGA